jgi:tripartite-type tricarboxylate transporter receptor subunit TctC
MKRFPAFAVIAVLASAALAAVAPGAKAADPYFKGRTVNLIVGFEAGGGVDVSARLFAPYFAKHIPGAPNVVVQNMAGGSAMKAHNFIFEGAKGDGENLMWGPWFPISQILDQPGVRFKYQDFALVGAVAASGYAVYVRTDTVPGGLKKGADILKAQGLKFAGQNPFNSFDLMGRMSLELFDVRYGYITGYRGSAGIRAAVMKGEANIGVDSANGYRTGVEATIIKPGIATPVWSLPEVDPAGKYIRPTALPEIPMVLEVYKEAFGKDPAGIKWEAMKLVMDYIASIGQVIVGPPSLDKAALADLRKGAYDAFADKQYLADQEKSMGSVSAGVPLASAEKTLRSLGTVKPELVAHIRSHVESGEKVKQ